MSGCVATFLCDRTVGSRSRHLDDQSAAGTRQLRDDHDLSARPPAPLGINPQSTGLAAGPTTTRLAASQAGHERADQPEKEPERRPKLGIAEILRVTAPKYIERHGQQAAPQVQSTLAKLSLCRTAALGGHRYRCDDCEHECVVYNSCGDRHCPQCAGAKRADWIDSTKKLLLEGVNYFQVVFTLPSELSSLALGNRGKIYDLLFASAWSALKETIETEQGYDPAALMVLHTWNQQLDAHGHVHVVVPGGGPALDGSGWVSSQRRNSQYDNAQELYLVDAVDLRRQYRDHFLTGLTRLRERGELKLQDDFEYLQDDEQWQSFLLKLASTEWVSYIQPPPPQADGQPCSAEHVLKYLARYLTGGPISEGRIIAADQNEVTFWAREPMFDKCRRKSLGRKDLILD